MNPGKGSIGEFRSFIGARQGYNGGRGEDQMPATNTNQNGAQHWVVVRPEPAGQFTAQALGLPEIRATAPTRAEALDRIHVMLGGMHASGQLVSVDMQRENPLLKWAGRTDPN